MSDQIVPVRHTFKAVFKFEALKTLGHLWYVAEEPKTVGVTGK